MELAHQQRQRPANLPSFALPLLCALLLPVEGTRRKLQLSADFGAPHGAPGPLAPWRSASSRPERCLQLSPGAAVTIRSIKQHFAEDSFLLVRGEDPLGPDDAGDAVLLPLMEALLNGCQDTGSGHPPWFVDFGTHDDAVAPLASSLGCAVLAFDPKGTKDLKMTRCINAPQRPFQIYPFLLGVNDSNVTMPPQKDLAHSSRALPSLALDDILMPPDADRPVAGTVRQQTKADANASAAEISLLRVAPHRCCGPGAALRALRGARGLLERRSVRCIATEMALDNSTAALVLFLRDLERLGYTLLHAGPLSLLESETAEPGSSRLFRTDAEQLHELYETFLRIRTFDERTATRAYGDGLSIDRSGRYFDHTDLIVACQEPLPRKLSVGPRAAMRFRGGRWWLESSTKGAAAPKA